MTAISFEKHLPRLFLEQLPRFREDEPFTVRLPAAVMMTDISGFCALALGMTRDGEHGVETLRSRCSARYRSSAMPPAGANEAAGRSPSAPRSASAR